jgi:hypothetical protein
MIGRRLDRDEELESFRQWDVEISHAELATAAQVGEDKLTPCAEGPWEAGARRRKLWANCEAAMAERARFEAALERAAVGHWLGIALAHWTTVSASAAHETTE